MPISITRRQWIEDLALISTTASLFQSPLAATQRWKYSRASVGNLLDQAESLSDAFRKTLDSALDSSQLNKSQREDDLNRAAKHLENEIDQAQKEFQKAKEWHDIRSNVVKAMDAGRNINVTMRNRQMGAPAERQWTALRESLNRLGAAFDVPLIR